MLRKLISLLLIFLSVTTGYTQEFNQAQKQQLPINYLNNGGFEKGKAGWVTYADAASTSPVDGTGGSPVATFVASATTPLRGNQSGLLTKGATNRQGDGFSYDFTIDPTDKGKVLQGSLEYQVVSGTYADNDISFWIYDKTNAVLIQPAPYLLKNSGIIDKLPLEFQTASNSTSYRLIGHISSTSAVAYSIRFDNFIVGPNAKLYGGDIETLTIQRFNSTGSATYTPTPGTRRIVVEMCGAGGGGAGSGTANGTAGGTGGNTTFGTSLLTANGGTGVAGNQGFVAGTGGSVTVSSPAVDMGSAAGGYGNAGSLSTSGATYGIAGGNGGANTFGGSGRGGSGGVAGSDGIVNTGAGGGGGSGAAISGFGSGSGGGAGGSIRASIPGPLAASYAISVGTGGTAGAAGTSGFAGGAGGHGKVVVYEYGLTSSQVISNDADTRIIAAIITGDPASASSGNPLIVPTVSYDTHSGYNATTGRYTVPTPGLYRIYGSLQSASSATTLTIYKNAVSNILAGNLDSNGEATFAGSVLCLAGDIIDLRPGGTVDPTSMTLNIERVSGPSQIFSGESVIANYVTTAGQSIPNNAATPILYGTKVQDSHNAYNTATGTWTAPFSGTYQVCASADYTPNNTTGYRAIHATGNGIERTLDEENAFSVFQHVKGCTSFHLLATQTIVINAIHTKGSAEVLTASDLTNYMTIWRMGNY